MGVPRLDPLAPPRRRRALLMAAQLAIDLRRAPFANEIAKAIRVDLRGTLDVLEDCRRYGLIEECPGRRKYAPLPVRLTVETRRKLGLPIVVYLAWPLPPPASAPEAHEAARCVGVELARWVLAAVPCVSPVSPYLAPHAAGNRATLDAAAAAHAMMCDAVLAYRDPLLIARADVSAALGAHIAATLIDRAAQTEISEGANPWTPPWLVQPQGVRSSVIHNPHRES
jgi:hypothetical protein